jgi:1L-myo-inositol 1-phosphate cytidylyltransferase
MPSTDTALILAAGNGSRLRTVTGSLPKPLAVFNGKPLLEHIIVGAHEAGVKRFVIVVGYCGEAIRSWVAERRFGRMRIDFVENPDYKNKANGVSLLKARHLLPEPFLLLMADHIFEWETAAALLRQRVEKDGTILAIDRKLDDIFDMDDATKVRCIADYIIDIGKQLTKFDAVDTGMFLCTPAIFSTLDQATIDGNCSLSDGMRIMAANRKLRGFDIGDGMWQDVDTPEALAYGTNVLFHPFTSNPVATEGISA